MAKTTNKRKVRKKRQSLKENCENGLNSKVKKVQPKGRIALSKQLASKKQNIKSSKRISSNSELKILQKGRITPSLAVLEKMYDDSYSGQLLPLPETSKVPMKETIGVTNNNLLSLNSDNKRDNISNVCDSDEIITLVLPDDPPLAVCLNMKRKKPEVINIVDCKDYPQVNQKPCGLIDFCKSDPDHDTNSDYEDEDYCRRKRSKVSSTDNFSNSICNAKSDDTLGVIKTSENYCSSDATFDSNKTEGCGSNASGRPLAFSPKPSSSKDNKTILENDKLFLESLLLNESIDTNQKRDETDLQVFEIPSETIVIDDEIESSTPLKKNKTDSPAIRDNCFETIEVCKTDFSIKSSVGFDYDDNSCMVVEHINGHDKKKSDTNCDLFVVDDEYRNLDFDNMPLKLDEDEIIDVDKLIAENSVIVKKIQESKTFDSVIEVTDVPEATTQPVPVTQKEVTIATSIINNSITRNYSNTEQTANRQCASDVILESSNGPLPQPDSQRPRSNAESIQKVVTDFFKHKRRQNMPDVSELPIEILNTLTTKDYNNITDLESQLANLTAIINSVVNLFPQSQCHSRQQITDGINPIPSQCYSNSNVNNVGDPVNHSFLATRTNRPHKRSKKQKTNTVPVTIQQPVTQQTTTFAPPQGNTYKNIGDCPICMDSLSSNAIASTICGHVFCLKCIQAAIAASGKRCPTCRKVLKGNGYHQLYL